MTKILKRLPPLACALALAVVCASCGAGRPFISDTRFTLDTQCTISLYDKQDESILKQALDLCDHYNNLFSMTAEGSDIYNINHANGAPVRADADTINVIKNGIRYSEISGGLFDITVGALTTLWNFDSKSPGVPDADKIKAALKTVDYRNIVIQGDTVTLKNPDAMIDLGGCAKGYIADRVKDFLASRGVRRAIINLGGNVVVMGSKGAGKPWVVGVQQPFMDRNVSIGYLYVSDKSVVTSGIYERYFNQDGKLYFHILDPTTGYPADNNLASVTIVSDESAGGDGLSSACFLLGADKAKALVESLPDTEAVFVTKDNRIITTPGIGAKIKFVKADAAGGADSAAGQ